MRDLKHLIFMEDLLQEANNDLVKQAKAEGRRALGYTCNFMPEVLLDLAGCFSVRLRAPRSGSPDMATYYMSARTCHFGRSLMERALEGGFNFLDAQMATETCTVTCRFQEHLMQKHLDSVKDMDIIQNPDFFCEFTDVPFKKTENSYLHYRRQLQAHVLDPLTQNFGIDTSDEALLKAIEQHNEVCRLITEIGSYRKLDVPTITGYEFHVIQLASLTCPKDLILPYLRELDMALVMTVVPGFGGQALIPETLEKVRVIRRYITAQGLPLDLEVDGGLKPENVKLATDAGANVIVAGSAIFQSKRPRAVIAQMRSGAEPKKEK